MARPQEFDTEQALNQAIELFWKNGYERTSLNDLLKHMHIRRSSFYNAFGDKRGLFIQALDKYMKVANDDFIVDTLRRNSSGLEGIQQVFRRLVDILATDAEYKGCLMVNTQIEVARTDAAIKQMIGLSLDRIHDALYDALERAQAAGEIRPDVELEATSKFLISTIISLRVMGRYTNNHQDFYQVARVALSLLKQ